MAYRHTESHIACFFIGAANYYPSMARSSRPDVVAELGKMARNRKEALDVKSQTLGINSMALLDQMTRTANTGISIP
jgi:hypothetical protein